MLLHAHLHRVAELVGGTPVLECFPGGPALEAGLRFGDIVLAVNDVPTPTLEAYLRALDACRETPTLLIFRDGERLEFRMRLERASSIGARAAASRATPVGHA